MRPRSCSRASSPHFTYNRPEPNSGGRMMAERGGNADGSRLAGDELAEFLAGAWICRLATLTEDGFPYVTPLWFEYDGEGYVFIGRERAEWIEHIRHNPRVGFCIDDPDGSHRRVV